MRAAEIGDRPLRADEPQQREAERRLAGAGFADDAERLALAHVERDAVDRLDIADGAAQEAALDREPDADVFRLDDRLGACDRACGGSPFGSAASSARV